MIHVLFFFILLSYIVTILFLFQKCNSRHITISRLICDKECQTFMLSFVLIFGILVCFYEWLRKDNITFWIVFSLIISLFGLITFNEKTYLHYLFAGFSFFSMILFMIYKSSIVTCKIRFSFFVSILLVQFILLFSFFLHTRIFWNEVAFCLLFAIFYISNCHHFS